VLTGYVGRLENCTGTESEPVPHPSPSFQNRARPVPVAFKPVLARTHQFQTHTRPYPWYSAHLRPLPQTQIANMLLEGCKKVVNAQNSAIITHKLYSLQSMQKQQSVDRFCRQHISSIFKSTPGKGNERLDGVLVAHLHSKMYGLRHTYARTPCPVCPRKLLNPSLRWARVIGPIPAVKPWSLSPYLRVPRGPRGEPAIPVPVQFF